MQRISSVLHFRVYCGGREQIVWWQNLYACQERRDDLLRLTGDEFRPDQG